MHMCSFDFICLKTSLYLWHYLFSCLFLFICNVYTCIDMSFVIQVDFSMHDIKIKSRVVHHIIIDEYSYYTKNQIH